MCNPTADPPNNGPSEGTGQEASGAGRQRSRNRCSQRLYPYFGVGDPAKPKFPGPVEVPGIH